MLIILSKTKEHKKYDLVNNEGLNDLLGVLISMKNIQVKENFNKLIDDISDLIDSYIKNNNTQDEIYNKILHLLVSKIRLEYLEEEKLIG